MTAASILLVEDDDDHAELFRTVFARTGLGHELVRAKTVAEAGRVGADRPLWAVVLDLGLPDSTGLETIHRLEERVPRAPLVVLTANSEDALSVEAIRSGAQDYLVKGQFTPELLSRSLRYAVERKQLWLELERKNQEVEAFALIASHDLQSPLRRIEQCAEMVHELLDADADPNAVFLLESLKRDSRRLQLLVKDILSFARAGANALSPAPFALREAVDGALAMMTVAIESSSAKVIVDELPEVTADRRFIEQLLQNLISNAIKYVRDRAPEVRITAEERDRFHVVHVGDNGIGIAADQIDRVFRPLVRAVGHDEFEGSGLGLSSCRKLVEAHGGEIWVESDPPRGSTFSFSLPKRG